MGLWENERESARNVERSRAGGAGGGGGRTEKKKTCGEGGDEGNEIFNFSFCPPPISFYSLSSLSRAFPSLPEPPRDPGHRTPNHAYT